MPATGHSAVLGTAGGGKTTVGLMNGEQLVTLLMEQGIGVRHMSRDYAVIVSDALKNKLELILEGEAPYDIFVRWKPMEKQLIGWDPDLNDGVRLNIRPFTTAGVLHENKKPKINITWNKDRGKDVESAPWYPVFDGDRINDHHLTLAEKRTAKDKEKQT